MLNGKLNGTKGKILVVDDEPASRSGLEVLLRRRGYEVISVGDGGAALEQYALAKPDLVVLDVLLPGMNGIEVCRRLKSRPETRLTPVILVTGLTDAEDRVRGIEAGADDFLSKPIDPSELLARLRSSLTLKTYTDELENAESVLFTLALSIEGKDPYTHGHCQRLAEKSARLGERVGIEPDQITALRRAGIVHDIGKVAVPDAILLKPGTLNKREKTVMRQHPVVGERICAPLRSFRLVLPIIRHHHEKQDGSGYPDGLQGEEVPITARILQLVDVYDALTTKRPYRRALSSPEALEIMTREVKKGWWDARLFAEFADLVRRSGAPKAQISSPRT
jgi:cyclic di-GMP phosphodiesterase